jgi:hypothetical protein
LGASETHCYDGDGEYDGKGEEEVERRSCGPAPVFAVTANVLQS